jgi:GT2 family glycosyltransferase
MKVSVVIVTFNGVQWIEKVIKSVFSNTINVEIIIIDNNSADETVSVIKQYKEINLIESKTNLGFGKANNIGIKKAYESGADYVFLLNQDAWGSSDTIENLVQAHQREPEYGILSPMHLNGMGTGLDYNFSNYIIPSKCKNLYSDIFLNSIQKKIYETEFVNAAAWLISRKCIEIVGGFNPSFFHYGEDDNYVHRVKFHQFKVGIYPTSIIYHDRLNNAKNNYFKDEKRVYSRSMILKISNPRNEYLFEKEYRKGCILLFKALIFFRFKKIKEALWKIKILNHLDKKQIIKNKLESYKMQPSFLN